MNNTTMAGVESFFPLHRGDPIDMVAESTLLPFGLRFAVDPDGPAVDFSQWGYDEIRQIAVVHDNGEVIDAGKHSTGKTQTPSGKQSDGTRDERDSDVTED